MSKERSEVNMTMGNSRSQESELDRDVKEVTVNGPSETLGLVNVEHTG